MNNKIKEFKNKNDMKKFAQEHKLNLNVFELIACFSWILILAIRIMPIIAILSLAYSMLVVAIQDSEIKRRSELWLAFHKRNLVRFMDENDIDKPTLLLACKDAKETALMKEPRAFIEGLFALFIPAGFVCKIVGFLFIHMFDMFIEMMLEERSVYKNASLIEYMLEEEVI